MIDRHLIICAVVSLWPHKDLGWWGFVLSVVAILLLYPGGVLVNITTPMLLDWWATRSRASLQEQIGKLEADLSKLEQIAPLSEVNNQMLWGLEMLRLLLSVGIHMVLSALYLLTILVEGPKRLSLTVEGVFWCFLIVNALLGFLAYYRELTYRIARSPTRRTNIKKSIKSLKSKLPRIVD